MKAADIPEVEFLAAVEEARCRPDPASPYSTATRWDVGWVLSGFDGRPDLTVAEPPWRFPEKVVRAKAKGLIRRGLVDGCGCGCRGDLSLTAEGRARLLTTNP